MLSIIPRNSSRDFISRAHNHTSTSLGLMSVENYIPIPSANRSEVASLQMLPPELIEKILCEYLSLESDRQSTLYQHITLSRNLHPFILSQLVRHSTLHSPQACFSFKTAVIRAKAHGQVRSLKISFAENETVTDAVASFVRWVGSELICLEDFYCYSAGGTLQLSKSSSLKKMALWSPHNNHSTLQPQLSAAELHFKHIQNLSLADVRIEIGDFTLWLKSMAQLVNLSIDSISLFSTNNQAPAENDSLQFFQAFRQVSTQLVTLACAGHLIEEWSSHKISLAVLTLHFAHNVETLHMVGKDIASLLTYTPALNRLRRLVIFDLQNIRNPTSIHFAYPNFPKLASVAIERLEDDDYWEGMSRTLEDRNIPLEVFDYAERFERDNLKWDDWWGH